MRNVLLVTVDSLRADRCGFLGCERDLTPAMDDMAREGVVFENAIAPGPRTPSSIPVVWTGEHFQSSNRGVYRNWEEKANKHVERRLRIRQHLTRFQTIAEQFERRGYDTAAVTANPWTASDTGFDRGFDEFHAVGEDERMAREGILTSTVDRLTGSESREWLLRWTDFFDVVEDECNSVSEPYFLWVFLLDPHQPYLTPRGFRVGNTAPEMYYATLRYNKFHGYTDNLPRHLDVRLERAYDDAVRSVDAFVERLQDSLESRPVTIVHADHGEAFGEHGFYGHRPQLHEELVHVPLLVHGIDEDSRISEVLPLRRLPDILRAVGNATPGGDRSDSEPTVDLEQFTAPVAITKTEEEEQVAVRHAEWKYVRKNPRWEYVHRHGEDELYRLIDDPTEEHDVIDEYPEAAKILRSVLDRHAGAQREHNRITRAVKHLDEVSNLRKTP